MKTVNLNALRVLLGDAMELYLDLLSGDLQIRRVIDRQPFPLRGASEDCSARRSLRPPALEQDDRQL